MTAVKDKERWWGISRKRWDDERVDDLGDRGRWEDQGLLSRLSRHDAGNTTQLERADGSSTGYRYTGGGWRVIEGSDTPPTVDMNDPHRGTLQQNATNWRGSAERWRLRLADARSAGDEKAAAQAQDEADTAERIADVIERYPSVKLMDIGKWTYDPVTRTLDDGGLFEHQLPSPEGYREHAEYMRAYSEVVETGDPLRAAAMRNQAANWERKADAREADAGLNAAADKFLAAAQAQDDAATHTRNAQLLRAEADETTDAARRERLQEAANREGAAARQAREQADQHHHEADTEAAQRWERDRTGAQHSNDGAGDPGWIKPGSAADAQRVAERASREAEEWREAAEAAEEAARNSDDPLDRLGHENHAEYARKREEKERGEAEEFARRAEAAAEREAAVREAAEDESDQDAVQPNPPPVLPPPPRQPAPTPPPTTPSSSSSGASMSGSIGEAAAGIRGANDIAEGAIGTCNQAISQVEEARGQLQAAAAGSDQADVGEATGLFSRAIDAIQDAQKAIAAATSAAASVAARL